MLHSLHYTVAKITSTSSYLEFLEFVEELTPNQVQEIHLQNQQKPDADLSIVLSYFYFQCKHDKSAALCFGLEAIQTKETSFGWFTLGRIFSSRNEKERCFLRSIQLEKNSLAYNNLACLYIQSGSINRALTVLNQGIIQHKADPVLFGNRALVMRTFFNDYSKALKDYSRSLSIDPDQASMLHNRAVCYRRLGLLHAAKDDYEQSLRLDSERSQTKANLNALIHGMTSQGCIGNA